MNKFERRKTCFFLTHVYSVFAKKYGTKSFSKPVLKELKLIFTSIYSVLKPN
ncbi:hypothetical protein PRO82_000759 [Candidatus Protochlamydia amoebophila]|nr:hypothetical protein [Candidatus Protochlamydia amoebophila]